MQKTVSIITSSVIAISVIAVCVLRFYQLLKYTDPSTGYILGNGDLTYIIYGLLILGLVSVALYSFRNMKTACILDQNTGRLIPVTAYLLSAVFFIDFIHQCCNCFDYFQSTPYVEYNYIIPLAVSGISALLSCFYYATLAMTCRGTEYDFRNFTLIHFAPAAWAFSKLIVITVKIMDVTAGVETFCEFIFLSAFLCFSFCFISGVEKSEEKATRMFIFSALITFILSAVVALPRLFIMISGNFKLLNSVDFSCSTYIMLGIFSLALVRDIKKRAATQQ